MFANTLEASYSKNKSLVNMVLLDNFGGNIKQRIKEDGAAWTLGGSKTGVMIMADRTRTKAGLGRNLESPKPLCGALTGVQKDNLVVDFDSVDIRKLTPPECEDLQAFPRGWTEPLSDTRRWHVLGNAVTTNVIEDLGKELLHKFISSVENKSKL